MHGEDGLGHFEVTMHLDDWLALVHIAKDETRSPDGERTTTISGSDDAARRPVSGWPEGPARVLWNVLLDEFMTVGEADSIVESFIEEVAARAATIPAPTDRPLSEIESRLASAECRLASSDRQLERMNNVLDNYGIPHWPIDAMRARIQRMYRAWNIDGADTSLMPYTHEEMVAATSPAQPIDEKLVEQLVTDYWRVDSDEDVKLFSQEPVKWLTLFAFRVLGAFALQTPTQADIEWAHKAIAEARAAAPVLPPARFDLVEDPTRGLHSVLTRHGLASRSDFRPLVGDLIRWAADAYRSSLPQSIGDPEALLYALVGPACPKCHRPVYRKETPFVECAGCGWTGPFEEAKAEGMKWPSNTSAPVLPQESDPDITVCKACGTVVVWHETRLLYDCTHCGRVDGSAKLIKLAALRSASPVPKGDQ